MKRALLASLSLCLLLAGHSQAKADSFGAIAYSPSTGAAGWAYDHPSRGSAERTAQGNCLRNARDCRIAIWFDNACGAVAVGADGGWGSGWGYSQREAESQAIATCRRNSRGCRVVRWQCSGAR